MDSSNLRIAGFACLIVCLVCIFVAVERYQTNAGDVAGINQFGRSFPGGGIELKPATPTATKYALLFAVISGVGGALILAKSRPGRPDE